ncbi:3,4-dihydroxy-2-butanone-4-phosphate synthase [Geodermatophilus sp. DSM 45219]|uniref:3,4-dihydroxy-2-butanone-4-phosphate synthase n=1 Tax=Geodermatophilus sp. DSM 45219 TaxID=1881103 RepID=UPI000882BFB3|nr:3,4-dihydroxy-2-butanone-4-phosphate synthase [Geodermatophilus sp. DSM 45219]SDN70526.1 GTP cyclohydrolase II /3,4-dihydroxy-2-butanone 4-phosphate synthase [Geodermatophilus sp. DSM 45219]
MTAEPHAAAVLPARRRDATVAALRHATPWPAPAGGERVRAALADLAAGRPVALVDDEDGGALVLAAGLATPEAVAFVVRHTSGFLCVAVTGDDADRLDLPLLAGRDGDRPAAAQCVAVDARDGVGTGISAADRARTIRLLAAPDTDAADLVRPGHVVPLRARPGGVLARRGRAEAAVDLAVLAGLHPAGALCDLVSPADPRRTASGAELAAFAREHGLALVGVGDLVAHRTQVETLVERGAETSLPLGAGRFTAVGYRGRLDGREHLALVHGEIGDGDDVPVHVHHECLAGDVLGSARCGCGGRLQAALAGIAEAGRGVVVYVRGEPGAGLPRGVLPRPHRGADDPSCAAARPDDGVGGQILRDLGVRSRRSVRGRPDACGATASWHRPVEAADRSG